MKDFCIPTSILNRRLIWHMPALILHQAGNSQSLIGGHAPEDPSTVQLLLWGRRKEVSCSTFLQQVEGVRIVTLLCDIVTGGHHAGRQTCGHLHKKPWPWSTGC